ncbi:MAG: N-acetylmuramoyl-L-alanine amidase [Acutalibacteraceae bacterium]|nr:N-acetylmuramoyl-L-alanine amidase [Acutalibacteraceae bacterium]
MSYSSLVTYKNETSKCTSTRSHKIDTITIHCYVGQVTAKEGVDYFKNTTRNCSSNYVVGKDGSIGLSVDESNRSWCTSNAENDHRAVTIEVACDAYEPYAVTDKAYKALIELVADICKRNKIEKLVWSEKKEDRVNHRNGCNMTVHRDYANKSCPGEWLYSRHGEIAQLVNEKLGKVDKKEQFIEEIAKHVKAHMKCFGIKCASAVIAQACLESAYGTSNKAKKNNFFGLKFREGRLTVHNGTFGDGSKEQLKDGSYVDIADDWYSFETMEDGVIGYFQFTNIDRYKKLKGIVDPLQYLTIIKEAGYATSKDYVKNVMAVVDKYNLTRFDEVEKKVVHVVSRGETLSGIAAMYGTTFMKIAEENNIKNPNVIYVGQKLIITVTKGGK